MPRSRSVELYSLSFILVSIASAYPNLGPSPAPYLGGFQVNLPEPTTAPSNPKKYGFYARDTSGIVESTPDYYDTTPAPSTTIQAVSTSTSLAPASACGYIDGVWDDYYSLVYCGDSNECLFHTSDSSYPGMVGCCVGNDPNNCAYETTCYDADDISATPTLTSGADVFAIYCTASGGAACQTMVYPELSITGYGCAESSEVISVYTEGTYNPTTDTSYWQEWPTVAYVSASIVDDKWIDVYVSGTAATATTEMGGQAVTSTPDSGSKTAHSASASASASATAGGSDSSNKSSTNTGAIAGGVVGGVVGAAGIGAAAFMWWLLKKKKANDAAATGETSPALGGDAGTREVPTSVLMPPQGVDGITSINNPALHEVEGSSHLHYAEVDGYTADQKFPSAIAGSRDMKPQEMDSKNFVAELPAHNDEERPLSSDNSRPATPDARRS